MTRAVGFILFLSMGLLILGQEPPLGDPPLPEFEAPDVQRFIPTRTESGVRIDWRVEVDDEAGASWTLIWSADGYDPWTAVRTGVADEGLTNRSDYLTEDIPDDAYYSVRVVNVSDGKANDYFGVQAYDE